MEDGPAISISQEAHGVVDTGADSFSVDTTPAPVEGKAEEKAEEKPEEKPTEELAEKPTEESEEKPVIDEEELPKGVKKKLAIYTRKRRDAERETATFRAQNKELHARLEAMEHPKPELGEEPQINTFDTEEEYLEAVGEWRADKKVAERDKAQQAKQDEENREEQEAASQARKEALMASLRKGADKYDDFEDVMDDLNVTWDMVNILESLPNVSDVAYMLGNDPDMVGKLAEMPFLAAAYKMKEMSDNLLKKKTTKAPDPVTPVSTTGGLMKSLESMGQAEYNKVMNTRDKERRGLI